MFHMTRKLHDSNPYTLSLDPVPKMPFLCPCFSECGKYYRANLKNCLDFVTDMLFVGDFKKVHRFGPNVIDYELFDVFSELFEIIETNNIDFKIPYEWNFIWWFLEEMRNSLIHSDTGGIYAARLSKFIISYKKYLGMCPHDDSYLHEMNDPNENDARLKSKEHGSIVEAYKFTMVHFYKCHKNDDDEPMSCNSPRASKSYTEIWSKPNDSGEHSDDSEPGIQFHPPQLGVVVDRQHQQPIEDLPVYLMRRADEDRIREERSAKRKLERDTMLAFERLDLDESLARKRKYWQSLEDLPMHYFTHRTRGSRNPRETHIGT